MPSLGATGPRTLLRRLREIMAEQISAQHRLDKLVMLIATNMVAEVCSIYLRRAGKYLELFATGAIDRRRDLHAAAGGALTLHMALLRWPVQLGDQVARRVRDDDAVTQLVVFGISF